MLETLTAPSETEKAELRREQCRRAENASTIGGMNGPWAVLLRLALGTYPVLMAWCIWVTQTQFADAAHRDNGQHMMASDGLRLEATLRAVIADLPSPDWRARIIAIEDRQSAMMQSLARIEAKMERP